MEKQSFLKRLKKSVGPGFITGAADDDPSGIATYSQTGAMFGYSQLWVILVTYPFMTTIQEMCGRIGMVTGKGLAGVIKGHYSKKVLAGAVFLLLTANIINIGADLGAMAASVQLLVPAPFVLLLFTITFVTLGLEIFIPYKKYAHYLKYLTVSLLAYVVTAFVIKQDWGLIAYATVVPHIAWSQGYILNIAAVLGTTISPYLFFWQASEEVEEEVETHKIRAMGVGVPKVTTGDMHGMRIDTALGMFFSQIVTFFIIVSVASTLGAGGIHSVDTAEEAAQALRPFAGTFASLLFTLGILGTGLLAVPVLAGSAGYAVAEAVGWKEGLSKRAFQAKGFYIIIALSTLVGLVVNLTPIGPMTMLYYSAMLNGVLAPPLMILLILVSNNKKILGKHVNSTLSNILAVTVTVVMSVVALLLLISLL